MDKADSDFLHQLFRENNELRGKFTALQRELYNKTVQNEQMEDEIRQLKLRLEDVKTPPSRPTTQGGHARKGARVTTETVTPAAMPNAAKDLAEALFTLDRKSVELKQVREDLAKAQTTYEDELGRSEDLRRTITEMQDELNGLRQFRANALKEAGNVKASESNSPVSDDLIALQDKLLEAESTIQLQKRQIMEVAADANRRHNEQQSQLQGVEALVEGIRREYDEFIEIAKLENESYRNIQQEEYEKLREQFETHKRQQYDEKKALMAEYQALLYSMQAQFDEYRTTTEFLFNTEVAKLEDELLTQAARYEQEILYVIQAKDKFYADMMVAKDAKIMNLIEGSDLQTLMQKHELDLENIRKEHAREIERVKSDQESEQKNLVSLLQRQNVSLESKYEKLQAHLKTLEQRIKDLMQTIEVKNKVIADREEAKLKSDAENQKKLDEMTEKIHALSQEKEHLRHKVIRLALDAKGEGHDSVENMLKRISRETYALRFDYEGMSAKYDSLLSQNQLMSKQLKEKEKFTEFLEKEVNRRTEEFQNMTHTFEDFLAARARQARKERAKRLMKLHGVTAEGESEKSEYMDSSGLLRVRIPDKQAIKATIAPASNKNRQQQNEGESRKADMDRGYEYLRRFKTLSRAFASGDFRILPTTDALKRAAAETPTSLGPWQKTPLYARLDEANTALARLYNEPPLFDATKHLAHATPKLYSPESDNSKSEKEATPQNLRIYGARDARPGGGSAKRQAAMDGKVGCFWHRLVDIRIDNICCSMTIRAWVESE